LSAADCDPEYIEMQGWMGPEGMAVVEEEVADGQAALSSGLQAMGGLLASGRRGASPMQISAICETFGLDAAACARVEAYLGRLAHVSERVTVSVAHLYSGTVRADVLFAISLRALCSSGVDASAAVYRVDVCSALNALTVGMPASSAIRDRRALFKFGDRRDASVCYPTFYKTRLLSRRDDNYVLLDLNHERHWGALSEVPMRDIPFQAKAVKLRWRGVSTGKCDAHVENSRMMLCKKWFSSSDARIDVGFNEVVQNCTAAHEYVKRKMDMKELLEAKYILVVNGNDKASGLNWALASESVPFMVEPDIESWLLESSLKAWEHYVPVQPDFSDLSSQIDWAENNADEAKRIAKAGQNYMRQFGTTLAERKAEKMIQAAILTAYLDRVEIKTGGVDSRLEGNCSEPL
jgi:hypothetical protein